jgi:peptidyl-prolyl cis-trans isomerase D
MLQQIRDHLTGWVAALIFAPLILAFALWGIQNYQVGGRSYAAKVNGEEISLDEVQEAARNRLAMFQQFAPEGLSSEQEARIRAEVVNSFIRREVLAQRARKQGYRISDAAVSAAIAEIPQFQTDGRFDRGTYERLLALQGYTPASFEAAIRRDLGVQQLQDGLTRSSFATPAELQRQIELEGEQREVAYVLFPAGRQEAGVQVTEAEIQARYEARRSEYVTPETVAIEYVELQVASLASGIEVGEPELREQYDADVAGGRFQQPEERRARHLLLKLEGQEEAAVQAQAEGLLARARAGEDFAALAREKSQDESTAQEGGELGWVTRDMMVEQFSDALFALEPGGLAGPVRTQFGLHLIRLEEVRGGEVQPYEAVRDELLQELRQRRADSLYYERAERLGERAFEARDALAPLAQELGLELKRVEGVTREQGTGIAAEAPVRAAAFAPGVLEDGENSDVVELGTGHALVLRVVDRKPQAQRALEEVRAEIEAQLRSEGARARTDALATDALARLGEGAALDALALQLGGEYRAPEFVGRRAAPAELMSAVFAAPKPSGASPHRGRAALANGDQAVFVVTAVRPGRDLAPNDEQRETRAQALASSRANADLATYIAELQAKASVVLPPSQLDPFQQPAP